MPRLGIFLLLLAHWINSLVLSEKGGKKKHQGKNQSGPATPKEDVGSDGAPESPSESEFLADFARKHRLWVITAPSHSDNYLRMMEKQIQESEGLNWKSQPEKETLSQDVVESLRNQLKITRDYFCMLVMKIPVLYHGYTGETEDSYLYHRSED
ncbi:hypothetical protein cypCar_00019225 [Cyprinus carpio]|nr:hypothetical protein cypCar_00019225 [Cyprinus carpio]